MSRRLLTFVSILSLLACLTFAAFLPFAWHFYTSLGLDFERPRADHTDYTYLRLRWPGDGSLLLGLETIPLHTLNHQPIPIDLAATFLASPRPLQPRPRANRLGFWLITHPTPNSRATSSFWLGIPAFLPVIVLALSPLLCLRALRKRPNRA